MIPPASWYASLAGRGDPIDPPRKEAHMHEFALERVEPSELTALDLLDEAEAVAAAGEEVEAYHVWGLGPERGDLLYVPAARRGGLAHGAQATWTDADSPEEVVTRVLSGDIID
jgi:hypothetical protein